MISTAGEALRKTGSDDDHVVVEVAVQVVGAAAAPGVADVLDKLMQRFAVDSHSRSRHGGLPPSRGKIHPSGVGGKAEDAGLQPGATQKERSAGGAAPTEKAIEKEDEDGKRG